MKNSKTGSTALYILLTILLGQGCKKLEPALSPVDPIVSQTDSPGYVALIDVVEDNTASTDRIITNNGFKTIYRLSINARPGDILRIRGQVEMTNDQAPFESGNGSVTVRGNIRILADGSITGSTASQNNVATPYETSYHHMHHMPSWADALYYITHTGETKIEIQYATTKSGSSPTVKIEPYGTTTPHYGHLVVEHYRKFNSRQAAQDSSALGLDLILSDKNRNALSFHGPTNVYSIQCDVNSGDIVRLYGQATSSYLYRLALHGQIILRNGNIIGPYSTENNISRIPNLPLWTDAVDKPSVNGVNEYVLRLHSLMPYGSASIADAGYLYGLRFRKLDISPNAKQLVKAKMINGPQSNYSLLANSNWHKIINYTGQASIGDILKVTGFVQFAGSNAFQDGINCQFRIRLNGETVQSGKYVTEYSEVVPLRAEFLKAVDVNGAYTIEVDVLCSRWDANPTVTIVGGKSGILLEHFSNN